jgi:UDP-2,4-diacetamido-2,4,6-trideoxy-beta-L-altropyranose hydrolase
MRFAIRTDSSTRIATGHVMRCLALAHALRADGHEVIFICKDLPGHIGGTIGERGFLLYSLPASASIPAPGEGDPFHYFWLEGSWEEDARRCEEILRGFPDKPVLILDHYALDRRWETALRPYAERIAVIDDLADRRHDCDLLVDQNLYADMETRYDGLMPPSCALLFGPRYALLREEFSRIAPRLREEVRHIFVSFGGIDPDGMTLKAAEALAALTREERLGAISVSILAASRNPRHAEIRRLCEQEGFEFSEHADDMAARMGRADLAVGAGGTTTWERCALGLPGIVYAIADNQRRLVEDGAGMGIHYAPDGDGSDMALHIAALVNNRRLLRSLSSACLRYGAADGAKRVARRLAPAPVALVRATAEDSKRVRELRNGEFVRRFSHSALPIAREDHERWYGALMADENRVLWLAKDGETLIGAIRYDVSGNAALVSLYLREESAGKGVGAAMLAEGERRMREMRPELTAFDADILPQNAASRALFVRDGYRPAHTRYRKELN